MALQKRDPAPEAFVEPDDNVELDDTEYLQILAFGRPIQEKPGEGGYFAATEEWLAQYRESGVEVN